LPAFGERSQEARDAPPWEGGAQSPSHDCTSVGAVNSELAIVSLSSTYENASATVAHEGGFIPQLTRDDADLAGNGYTGAGRPETLRPLQEGVSEIREAFVATSATGPGAI